jgi:hypothetical protein
VAVSAHQHHGTPASTSSSTTGLRGPEHRAIGRLADLVGEIVTRLERQGDDPPLYGAVAECNAALEVCLEAQRESRVRESVVTAPDELKRLARLLTMVEVADAVIVMRQIRRVLGRFDVCDA